MFHADHSQIPAPKTILNIDSSTELPPLRNLSAPSARPSRPPRRGSAFDAGPQQRQLEVVAELQAPGASGTWGVLAVDLAGEMDKTRGKHGGKPDSTSETLEIRSDDEKLRVKRETRANVLFLAFKHMGNDPHLTCRSCATPSALQVTWMRSCSWVRPPL